MAQLIKIIVYVAIITMIASCIRTSGYEGVYVATPFVKNADTLKLYEGGKYSHVIYDLNQKKLIINNVGKWEEEGNRIVLYGFLSNNDSFDYISDSKTYDHLLGIQFFNKSIFSSDLEIDYDLGVSYEKIE